MDNYLISIVVILISIVSIYFIIEYFVKFNIDRIYEYPNMLTDEQCKEIISIAKPLYEFFIEEIKKYNLNFKAGKFGAMMNIELINNGPVTIILES